MFFREAIASKVTSSYEPTEIFLKKVNSILLYADYLTNAIYMVVKAKCRYVYNSKPEVMKALKLACGCCSPIFFKKISFGVMTSSQLKLRLILAKI